MAIGSEGSAYRQIRNLLAVLLLGVLCAGAMAMFFLHYYGPSGVYLLKNVMVDPSLAETLSYTEGNGSKGKTPRHVFDRLTFSSWSPETKRWEEFPVTIDRYAAFYETFAAETGSGNAVEEVSALFMKAPPARLTLYIRTASGDTRSGSRPFQELQFAADDAHFRVELHEEGGGSRWAYFRHPGILKEAEKLFAGKAEGA